MKTPIDVDFNEKLSLYKTAFSPLYETYVKILRHYFDDNGEPVITAWVLGNPENMETLFRRHELTNYCL